MGSLKEIKFICRDAGLFSIHFSAIVTLKYPLICRHFDFNVSIRTSQKVTETLGSVEAI